MNQSLRDFSDRHFIIRFQSSVWDKGGAGSTTLGRFQRYEDASRFQKDVIQDLKRQGFHKRCTFPIGWYLTLYGVHQPWPHDEWPMVLHYVPKEAD